MSVDTMALLESRLNCIPALDEQNFLLDEAVGWGEEWLGVSHYGELRSTCGEPGPPGSHGRVGSGEGAGGEVGFMGSGSAQMSDGFCVVWL